jgi:hypothetical protein
MSRRRSLDEFADLWHTSLIFTLQTRGLASKLCIKNRKAGKMGNTSLQEGRAGF